MLGLQLLKHGQYYYSGEIEMCIIGQCYKLSEGLVWVHF